MHPPRGKRMANFPRSHSMYLREQKTQILRQMLRGSWPVKIPSTMDFGSIRQRILTFLLSFCSGCVASERPSIVTRGGPGLLQPSHCKHAPAATAGRHIL